MFAPEFIFVLLLAFIVVGIPVICLTAITLTKLKRGRRGKGGSGLDAEEARLVQELHQGLSRLEKRIESLETIVLERK